MKSLVIVNTPTDSKTIRRKITNGFVRYNSKFYRVEEQDGFYKIDIPVEEQFDGIKDQDIINKAYTILEKRALESRGQFLESPEAVKRLFQLHDSGQTAECLNVAYLTQRHTLICIKKEFKGGPTSCSVSIPVIAQRALSLNAQACVIWHRHPSGNPSPSRADCEISQRLKKALDLFEIRLLDSIVTTDGGTVSLAERGEL